MRGVPGGPSCRLTELAADCRLRRAGGGRRGLLRHAPVVVRALAVAEPRVDLRAADPGGVFARVVRAAALAGAAAAAARTHDHAEARARLLLAVVRVPGAGRGRRSPARPAGPALLRSLPRRGRPLESPHGLDLDLPDRLARRHAGACDVAVA